MLSEFCQVMISRTSQDDMAAREYRLRQQLEDEADRLRLTISRLSRRQEAPELVQQFQADLDALITGRAAA